MASFFRKRIAQKVLSTLHRNQELKIPSSPNLLSSVVKINKLKSNEPELILPWKKIEQIYDKKISVSPKELVRLLRNQGLPTAEGFIDIKLSETPLHLIFTVDKHIFSKLVLINIYNNEDDFAKSSCLFENIQKQNILVQCSGLSVGEFFHFTHFRTMIHSNFVANINKFAGHNVTHIAHVNDWGLEAAIFLTGYQQFKLGKIHLKQNSSSFPEIRKAALSQYKNDFQFKLNSDLCYNKMKQDDKNVLSEWQELTQKCMEFYDSICKRLGLHFDSLHFHSTDFTKSEKISDEMLHTNIFNKEEGYKISCDELKNNSYLNENTDIDSALYHLSRHISAISHMKKNYNFEKMYCVSPSTQQDFFSAFFYSLKKMNFDWADKLHHINLKSITSSDYNRKLKLSIDTVLDQIKDGMITKLLENLHLQWNDTLEEMAENLSVSSLVINDMRQRRNANYSFEWQDIISFKKDTAASFQFCFAGLKGICSKAILAIGSACIKMNVQKYNNTYKLNLLKRLQENSDIIFKADIDTSTLLEPEAHHLIKHLASFDEVVYKAYTHLEPSLIYKYLCTLWYLTDRVTNIIKLDIKADRLIVIKARLLLLSATQKVLYRGLLLLGISPLEKVYVSEKSFVQSS